MTEQLIYIPKTCKPSAKFTVIVDPPCSDMSIDLIDGISDEVFQHGEVKMRTTEIAIYMFRPRKLIKLDNDEVKYQEHLSPGEVVHVVVSVKTKDGIVEKEEDVKLV